MTNYLIHYGPSKNDRGMSNYLMHFGRSKKDDPSLPIGTGNWRRDGSESAKAEYKASKLDRKAAAYQRKAAALKRKSTRWFMPINSEKAERKAAKYELKASKYSEKASKIRTKEAKAKYNEEKLLAKTKDSNEVNQVTSNNIDQLINQQKDVNITQLSSGSENLDDWMDTNKYLLSKKIGNK